MVKILRYLSEHSHKNLWLIKDNYNFFKKILKVTLKINNHLPLFLKKPFIKHMDSLGLSLIRFTKIILNVFSPFYIIESLNKKSRKKVRILFRGDIKSTRFFLKKILGGDFTIKKIGFKINSERIHDRFDIRLHKTDLFFKQYYQKRGYIIVPEHTTFLLNIPNSLDEFINRLSPSIIKDLQKAKKIGYSFEISNDIKKFKLFYHSMYLPYVNWKHKEKSRIVSFEAISHLAAQGAELLLIKKNEDYVFGGMFIKNEDKIVTSYAGLMEGKFNHLYNGIMALSYYYLILIAKDYSCKSIDFGTSRPFKDDGLYKYKKKWKMDIIQTSPFISEIFSIKILNRSSSLKKVINSDFLHHLN